MEETGVLLHGQDLHGTNVGSVVNLRRFRFISVTIIIPLRLVELLREAHGPLCAAVRLLVRSDSARVLALEKLIKVLVLL